MVEIWLETKSKSFIDHIDEEHSFITLSVYKCNNMSVFTKKFGHEIDVSVTI